MTTHQHLIGTIMLTNQTIPKYIHDTYTQSLLVLYNDNIIHTIICILIAVFASLRL